ncbi:MAG: DUF4330 domain-containing protein [Cyanobacteria bacterium SIG26]|nr:DUF4330 domain-containing protein [Cyanobacteria bacterium SIG26]
MEKFIAYTKDLYNKISAKVKLVDLIVIICVIIAILVGLFTCKGFRQTADKQIEATSNITFKVYMRGVTFSGSEVPLKKGDKTFISIRNVPYSDLDIVDVKADRKKIVLPTLNSKTVVIVVDDVSQPDLYDIVVTLTDKAKITKDGAVVGGNKVKMGLPITLEGADYKFSGTVSDVKVVDAVVDEKLTKEMNTTDDVQ